MILIDARNLAHRVHWTHRMLSYEGMPVSLLFGFFSSLVSIKRRYTSQLPVIVWDGGYDRRQREADEGVRQGIIPSGYKANRRKPDEDLPPDVEIVHEQIPPLMEALKLIRVVQIEVAGEEADDIIFTLAKQTRNRNTIITSDKDYLQILDAKNEVYDAMKSTLWTDKTFRQQYEIAPKQWVDVGALQGDKSDNIHGVPGIGEKYALKYVKEFGNISLIYDALKKKEKPNKRDLAILEHEQRVWLARSLKEMRLVPDLPALRCAPRHPDGIQEWFRQFGFKSLIPHAQLLTR